MTTEAQDFESRGRLNPVGHIKRFSRCAAGAASRLGGFLKAPATRKKRGPQPVASVSSGQLLSDAEPEQGLDTSQWGLIRSRSVTRAAEAGTFPCQLCISTASSLKTCQDLVTTGSRLFGLGGFGSALKVRIYDFAVYVHPEQAKLSSLARTSPRATMPLQQAQFCKSLRSSDDIDMSLMVRAARNLPIKLLAKEYERILRRRIQRVGGSQADKALAEMIRSFDETSLPESIKQGGSVKKGTLLTFTKQGSGKMTARANGVQLMTVESPKLCQAVFDLYLGDQPVSKESRQAAGDAVMGMMGAIPYHSPAEKGLCTVKTNSCQILT